MRTIREPRLAGVKLTHPQRVLYPDVGITKLDLARFYERISERMLPYLVDRPLTLVRAPEGMRGQRFFVRHAGDWAPRELRQFEITGGTGAGTAMIVDDVRGLIALAQMNVLEIHPWNARTRDLERPDRIVFDLDPGPEVPGRTSSTAPSACATCSRRSIWRASSRPPAAKDCTWSFP
jgi:bifunctional non-homologous end joining protein LigD